MLYSKQLEEERKSRLQLKLLMLLHHFLRETVISHPNLYENLIMELQRAL